MACLAQTWTSDYAEQVSYIDTLLNQLLSVDLQNTTISLYQNTEPTATELIDAWEFQTGTTDDPPVGSSFLWFSPSTSVIENIYKPVDDISDGLSTGVPITYYVKDRSLDWVFLDEMFALDDTALASFNLQSINQEYTHLFLTHSLRAIDAAVTTNLLTRINTIATVNYYFERLIADGAAVAAVAAAAQATFVDTSALIAATTAEESAFSSGYSFIPSYSDTTDSFFMEYFGRRVFFNNAAAPPPAASKDFSVFWGMVNVATALPVNRIDFLGPAATFRRGSNFVIYGLK
jgi:hypothetical protein